MLNYINRENAYQAERLSSQFRKLLPKKKEIIDLPEPEKIGLIVSFAYPDRIAKRREKGGVSFTMANGRGARISGNDILKDYDYIAAPGIGGDEQNGIIYWILPLNEKDIEKHFANHILIEKVVQWDERKRRTSALEIMRLGKIILHEKSLKFDYSVKENNMNVIIEQIKKNGLSYLNWTQKARDFQYKIMTMRKWFAEDDYPDVSNEKLMDSIESWLKPYLTDVTREEDILKINIFEILHSMMDWKKIRKMEEAMPDKIIVPTGSAVKVNYSENEAPYISVKLQEMFGLCETPKIGLGKIPLVIHLLSPARRPIQITNDLAGFWKNTYFEVKKELKGRYPKHPWPENPLTAEPTKFTKNKLIANKRVP